MKIKFKVFDSRPGDQKKLERSVLKHPNFQLEPDATQAEVILFFWEKREYAVKQFKEEMNRGHNNLSALHAWWVAVVPKKMRDTSEVFHYADEILVDKVDPYELKIRYEAMKIRDQSGAVLDLRGKLTSLTHGLAEDAHTLERIHEMKALRNFPKIRGVQMRSRYFAGLSGGSDFFECFDLPNEQGFRFLFTDSATYGIAGKVLALMGRVAGKIGISEPLNSWLQTFLAETKELREKGPGLQIFLGEWKRESGLFEVVGHDAKYLLSLNQASLKVSEESQVWRVSPGDKFMLLSDGAVERVGGVDAGMEIWNRSLSDHSKTSLSLFTELGFEKKQEGSAFNFDEVNTRDCTCLEIEWTMPEVKRLRPRNS